METKEIEKIIYNLAIENSIEINKEGKLEKFDSIAFVSFLVSLEDEFEITFPDTTLTFANMNSITTIKKIIAFLLENK